MATPSTTRPSGQAPKSGRLVHTISGNHRLPTSQLQLFHMPRSEFKPEVVVRDSKQSVATPSTTRSSGQAPKSGRLVHTIPP